MKSISLAIPFFNTSEYFTDCIKYAIDDDFVDEIIVNDDCSRQDEFDKLLSLVAGKDKVKVFRNDHNLGAFRNKYVTVKNCSNLWVYLLDSDNYPFEETYDVIRGIPDDYSDICFAPRKLYYYKDSTKLKFREKFKQMIKSLLILKNKYGEYENIADHSFKYDQIGLKETKDAIREETEWFDFFINTGNYVFNRDMYLDSLKEAFEDERTPLLHADTAAAFYFWLKNDGKFVVVDKLRHIHRIRPESYWHACGSDSMNSVNYYKDKIINL
jgi:GT2 family glycosyltransferase